MREYLRCAERVGCNEDALDACEELADRCPETSAALEDVVEAYVENCVGCSSAQIHSRGDLSG